jgi:hypothetical protein
VAARSEGDAALRGLCAEPTGDATLGARCDALLLTELPTLDAERDRSRAERRSSSSTKNPAPIHSP